jgi:pyruvate,water dikinase
VPKDLVSAPCLDAAQAVALGRMMRKAEGAIGGPVEIEWALDATGFKLLQARPLAVEPIAAPDEIWRKHPGLSGHPAGVGWGAGRAVVVNCECELSRVAPATCLSRASPAPP